jgi:hypothetical protein
MKTLESGVETRLHYLYSEEDLLQLEIQVAQRADALSRQAERNTSNDMVHWLQAEREVFAERSAYAQLGQE